ncbi:MAG TPA: tetratricopeptide repeat protein [Devosiaceae bacterium]|nr:tetratricopeptide repeat protein [Devosiaceae bacterium]
MRTLWLAGMAALLLSGCAMNATNTGSVRSPDFSGQSPTQEQATLTQLAARYKADPRDKRTIIYYAAALRAAGQPAQAVSVIEAGMVYAPNDVDLKVEYARALSAAGRYDQALNVITDAIQPDAPDWSSLLVKGAILDQLGRNAEARAVYGQALLIAPNEPSLEANLGLSYAMTNDLTNAEAHLRKAVAMPGATSKIRQNLAFVVGLEGRFNEAQTLFAAELPPDQVASNMAYIKSLLTQQNRWAAIKKAGAQPQ